MARGPVAAAAVDILRLVGRAVVGGEPARAGKLSREERKTQGASETARLKKEMAAGSAVLGAVLLLIVACFVAQANSSDGAAQAVESLPAEAPKLRRAIYGGAPILIECRRSRDDSSLVQLLAAKGRLPQGLRAATLDCLTPILGSASVEAFVPRFELSLRAPLLVLAGGGLRKPRQIADEHCGSADKLEAYLRRAAAPNLMAVNTTLDLRRYCLSRPTCLVLLSNGPPPRAQRAALVQQMKARRALGFVTVDRKTKAASFASQLPETKQSVLLALRPRSEARAEARAYRGDIERAADLKSFFAQVDTGDLKFKLLETPPTLSPRGEAPAAGEAVKAMETYDQMTSL